MFLLLVAVLTVGHFVGQFFVTATDARPQGPAVLHLLLVGQSSLIEHLPGPSDRPTIFRCRRNALPLFPRCLIPAAPQRHRCTLGLVLRSRPTHTVAKLSFAVSKGEAEFHYKNSNPQVRPALTRTNLLPLHVNEIPAHVLVDTGIAGSLLREDVRLRMK